VKELLERINELVNYISGLYVDSCLTTDREIVNSISKLQEEDCIVQVLPPSILTSKVHILIAAHYTFKSFKEGFNISRKPYIEFLLYLLGDRQVQRVISIVSNEVRNTEYLLVVKVCKEGTKPLTLSNCVKTPLEEAIKKFSDSRAIERVYGIRCRDVDEASRNVLLRTVKLYIDNV